MPFLNNYKFFIAKLWFADSSYKCNFIIDVKIDSSGKCVDFIM